MSPAKGPEVEISWTRCPNGDTRICVEVPSGQSFTEQADLSSSSTRQELINAVLSRWPGLDERPLSDALDAIARDSVRQVTRKGDSRKGLSQAGLLVAIGRAAELFHSPGDDRGTGYATAKVGNHQETWSLGSQSFSAWLAREYHQEHGSVPRSQAVQDAIRVLSGIAAFDGPEREVAVRIGGHDGAIYLDLASADWQVVRIDELGWAVIDNVDLPIRFIRKRGMLPLPTPEVGGSIEVLREVINLPNDDDWTLFRCYLVNLFRPGGPYPILILNGEQGSAKSSLCRIARGLVDPSKGGLRRPPRDERDLMIAASNAHVIAYDNLTGLSPSLADSMCTLATGGGFATRQLYTDDEERIFDAVRPIMLNGIDDLTGRPDLLDRSICLTLRAITASERCDEEELNARLDEIRPRVLGALLDAVSGALLELPNVQLERSPRMADFARFATAAESAIGIGDGEFLRTYEANRDQFNLLALESSPIAPVIIQLVESKAIYQGTATELLAELDGLADEKATKQRSWPKNSKSLANALRRIAPSLRGYGIEVQFHPPKGRAKRREITVSKA